MPEISRDINITRQDFVKITAAAAGALAVGEAVKDVVHAQPSKKSVRSPQIFHSVSSSTPSQEFFPGQSDSPFPPPPPPPEASGIPMLSLDGFISGNKELERQMESVVTTETPFLYRVVDKSNPISKEEIVHDVLPHLVHMTKLDEGKGIVLFANLEKDRVHELCVSDLIELFEAIKPIDKTVKVRSAYRDYFEQNLVFKQSGSLYAVPAGTSQHHTGLALDFTNTEVGNIVSSDIHFENTNAGKWLLEHAWEFGFIPSYTNGHDGITFESWHFVYVGKSIGKLYHDIKQEGWDGDIFDVQFLLEQKRISVGGGA